MTLVGATVAGVWGDIFHYPDDETVLDDTLACVRDRVENVGVRVTP